jgi:hypothetical protein
MTTRNLTLAVKSITSIDDSTEASSDEPYVLVVAADLTSFVPAVEVTLYGPWGNVDKGETHGTLVLPVGTPQAVVDLLGTFNVIRRPFWGLNNKPAPIANVGNVAFFVCVMEHDDGNPLLLREIVKAAATIAFINAVGAGLSHADIAKKIEQDIKGVIGTPTGFPNFDDVVGIQRLVLSQNDLTSGTHVLPTLRFKGGKEGIFDVKIELVFAS